MHTEIAAIGQQAQDRIGHRADAGLQYRSVFDVLRGKLRDRLIGFTNPGGADFDRRTRDVNGDVDLRRGNRLAERERNLRSEEHTSELQSLMRISYAVFCLKKKSTL